MTQTSQTEAAQPGGARIRAGSRAELEAQGRLLVHADGHQVCVFWHDGRAYALDDRCPHMGFPLHRGTVEAGLVTCHWHHARFDLASGGTLDPFADDAACYAVELDGDDVFVVARAPGQTTDHLWHRLDEGLAQGLSLVVAKAVIGLIEAGAPTADIVAAGIDFGTANRREGWGAGLTVLVALANLLDDLDPRHRALALTHGLAFVSRDTRGHPPRFALSPLSRAGQAPEVLRTWYRRSIETRSADAAERTLATAIASGQEPAAVATTMLAAVTDHVFIDVGHTLDFTNKAFEALDLLGWDRAGDVLATLVAQTAAASRSEESSRWRHPDDLASLLRRCEARLPELLAAGARGQPLDEPSGVSALGWSLLAEDPEEVVGALCRAIEQGASAEQLGRAVALAAGLRLVRFHVRNDLGDWNSVHHAFTAANALHQLLRRFPGPELLRGAFHGALRIFLDRFLNVPPARLPDEGEADLDELAACWDTQGGVDAAGAVAWRYLRSGGDPARLVAALSSALLAEDAQFHWYQVVEAAVAQHRAWPPGSPEAALPLVGAARFLAAHTPTRRELSHTFDLARRLRRGDDLYSAPTG